MNESITITATVAAWLPTYSKPQDLIVALESGNAMQVVNALQFYGDPSREKFAEYIRVGDADITVRLVSRDEQTRIALEALDGQLQKLRAAYMERQQEILSEISKLQALTNEVAS